MTERMRRVNHLVREVLAEGSSGSRTRASVSSRSPVSRPRPTCGTLRIYVSVLGGEKKREALRSSRLASAHGVLQARLSRSSSLKRTPQLAFEYDPTVERGVRMTPTHR